MARRYPQTKFENCSGKCLKNNRLLEIMKILFIAMILSFTINFCEGLSESEQRKILEQRYGLRLPPRSVYPSVKTTQRPPILSPTQTTIKMVEDTVRECKYPYKQWSDGTCSYLGKELYIKYKLIPILTNNVSCVTKCIGTYKILDVDVNGCRIAPIYNEDDDTFITGLKGYSGRTYYDNIFIKEIGDYKYRTVMGSVRVIPKYEYGSPITKEQFENYLKSQTNSITSNSADGKFPPLP